MPERLLIALALIAALVVAIALTRRLLRRRDQRTLRRLRDLARDGEQAGARGPFGSKPRVVYFTTSTCVVCRVQQEPALAALQERLTDLVVERHDAIKERTLAAHFGVITVPTTVVYDRAGELVTINRGFTPAAALRSQIEGAEPALEGGAEMSSERLG